MRTTDADASTPTLDPAISTSADLCDSLGLIDVSIDYNDPEFENITSNKVLFNLS
jgi:hypothetical protein